MNINVMFHSVNPFPSVLNHCMSSTQNFIWTDKWKNKNPTQTPSLTALTLSCSHKGILGSFFLLLFTVEFSIYVLRQDFSLLPKIACRWIPLLSGPCSFVLIMSAYDSANPVPFWSFGPALYTALF